MSELLGVLESLETMILDAKRLPFTNKVVIPDQDLLHFVDKLRILAKTEQLAMTVNDDDSSQSTSKEMDGLSQLDDLIQAKEEAKKITSGANEYAYWCNEAVFNGAIQNNIYGSGGCTTVTNCEWTLVSDIWNGVNGDAGY